MPPFSSPRRIALMVWVGSALAAFAANLLTAPPLPLGLTAHLFLLLGPGFVLYLARRREPTLLGLLLVSLAVGPVLAGAVGSVLMLAGLSPQSVVVVLAGGTVLAGIRTLAAPGTRAPGGEPGGAKLLLLLATLGLFALAVGYLPLAHEGWRIRADAWFHGAVVMEIRDFGLPPQDPYFAGMRLQYMWIYHVLVVVLSQASSFSPFVTMTLLNMQAMVLFGLGTFLVSWSLRRRFGDGYWSTLTAVLGINALFWLFLPLNFLKALTGEVRGWPALKRIVHLESFEIDPVRALLNVYFNQEFLLDKFIVATALSLTLGLMAALWYAVMRHLNTGSRTWLALAFVASLGMLAFHPLTGVLVYGTMLAALAGLVLLRSRLEDFAFGRILRLAGALFAAGAIAVPYLYWIARDKESEQLLPFGLSHEKLIGVTISCALGFILAWFQRKRLWNARTSALALLALGTGIVIAVALVIRMPASNATDKLPFLVFFPLAVAGGWTLSEFTGRPATRGRRRRHSLLTVLLLFGPLNGLALAAYHATPVTEVLSGDERAVAGWVRAHTGREALFLDSGDRVFLGVAGPRRYHWGNEGYAEQWGYDRAEMARRRALRDRLYGVDPLDPEAIRLVGALETPIFIIVREGTAGGLARWEAYPECFRIVFVTGRMAVVEADPAACRGALAEGERTG